MLVFLSCIRLLRTTNFYAVIEFHQNHELSEEPGCPFKNHLYEHIGSIIRPLAGHRVSDAT